MENLQWTDFDAFYNAVKGIGNKVEVNGVNLFYERVGTGDHAILLLPGALGFPKSSFSHQWNGLDKEKYTLIGIHLRGCGHSRPPDRDWPLLFFQQDAEDAASLMQTLGFSRYSVLGWSDGGTSAMILAGSYPRNVKKLIIWGTNAYQTPRDVEKTDIVSDLDKWNEKLLAPYLEMYEESYLRPQLKLWANAVQRYLTERDGDICVGSLQNIKCKTLIINGLKDLILQEHPLFLQKNIPNCRMVDFPEGRHSLHMKYHQEFNLLAQEFLDEPDPLDMETGN